MSAQSKRWLITFSWILPGFGEATDQKVLIGRNEEEAAGKLSRQLLKAYGSAMEFKIEKIEEVHEWSR